MNENITTIFFDVGGVLLSKKLRWNGGKKGRIKTLLMNSGYKEEFIKIALKRAKLFKKEFKLKNRVSDWEKERELKEGYCKVIADSLDGGEELKDKLFILSFDGNGYGAYEEVFEVLETLHGKYKLGIISNAMPSLMWSLESFELKKYFDVILISAIEGCSKPRPDIYIKALNAINSKPEECLFIDNKPKNIDTANSVGIQGILLDRHISNIKDVLYPILEIESVD